MSNTIINWRFWCWHLQVLQWSDWRWGSRDRLIRWSRNAFHARGGRGRDAPDWRPVEFYEGRRYAVALALLVGAMIWAVL